MSMKRNTICKYEKKYNMTILNEKKYVSRRRNTMYMCKVRNNVGGIAERMALTGAHASRRCC